MQKEEIGMSSTLLQNVTHPIVNNWKRIVNVLGIEGGYIGVIML